MVKREVVCDLAGAGGLTSVVRPLSSAKGKSVFTREGGLVGSVRVAVAPVRDGLDRIRAS